MGHHERNTADSKPVRSDQGGNAWQQDWSNTGGYTTSSTWYLPLPCCCGYQCSGTAAFYAANDAAGGLLFYIAAQCAINLQSVDPVLKLTSDNIGWNLISGGPPPSKSIDYGQGYTIQMPTALPTPCYMGTQGCNGVNEPPAPGAGSGARGG